MKKTLDATMILGPPPPGRKVISELDQEFILSSKVSIR